MTSGGTTIVTQTCPAPEHLEAFAAWQRETSLIIAEFPGFLRQTVLPPSPPIQVDWVILQHFDARQSAIDWLRSDARQERMKAIQGLVIGRDDVHLVSGNGTQGDAPVSAVISTRVKPGQEAAYRAWEQRIAAAQSQAPGFLGYRLEPPIPGIQEDWLALLKFETDDHLQAWLASPERAGLVAEAGPFTEEFHTRVARTGFDQWFGVLGDSAPTPAWKQNMIVLLLLYPVVFLFGTFVQVPFLMGSAHIPFATALFLGNVVSIILLNYLVPWTSRRLGWWLQPRGQRSGLTGTAMVVALYGVMVVIFTRFF
jgi:hypothetical protein